MYNKYMKKYMEYRMKERAGMYRKEKRNVSSFGAESLFISVPELH